MTAHTTADQDELPKDVAAAYKLIFDYTGDDIEMRLRMAVAFIRDDRQAIPKAYWTDLLTKIFEQEIAASNKQAAIAELEDLIKDIDPTAHPMSQKILDRIKKLRGAV